MSELHIAATKSAGHTKFELPRFEYLWQDSENFRRPTKMPAPEYIEHLMAWVQSNIDNEQMFPSRIGAYNDSCPMKPANQSIQVWRSQRRSLP